MVARKLPILLSSKRSKHLLSFYHFLLSSQEPVLPVFFPPVQPARQGAVVIIIAGVMIGYYLRLSITEYPICHSWQFNANNVHTERLKTRHVLPYV